MFKNISIIIVLSFLIIACNGIDKPKKPDNLISKDKMAEVLYDLYVINAAKGVNKKMLESNGFNPENYVLKKYNIDSLQFVDSNMYYAFNTEAYEAIIEQVKARLEMEKDEVEALQKAEAEAEKIRRDSINKMKLKERDTIKQNSKKLPD